MKAGRLAEKSPHHPEKRRELLPRTRPRRRHASDLRFLSVGDGVVTTLAEHTWEMEFLRGLPPMPESAA